MSVPEKSKGGRTPKIVKNDDLIDNIIECLKEGASYGAAAKAVGLSRRTLHYYMEKGRKVRRLREQEGEDVEVTPWDDHYLELVEKIDEAEAEIQETLIRRIKEAGKDNWTANAWILERRFPEDWSKTDERVHRIEGHDGGPVQFSLDVGEEPEDDDPMDRREVIEDPDYEIVEEDTPQGELE